MAALGLTATAWAYQTGEDHPAVRHNAPPAGAVTPLGTAAAAECPATAVTWDGGAGTGSWHDADNWNPNRLPELTDDVCIPAATPGSSVRISQDLNAVASLESEKPVRVLAGTLRVLGVTSIARLDLAGGTARFDESASVGSIDQTGGELTGAGQVVALSLSWSGGIQSGSGTTLVPASAQGVVFRGDGSRTLAGRSLKTESGGRWLGLGTLALQGADLHIAGGGFRVESSAYAAEAVVPITGTGTVNVGNGATLHLLTSFAAGVPFHNEGTVRWEAEAKLSLEGGGMHTGSFLLSPDPPAPAGILSLAGTVDHVFRPGSMVRGEARGTVAVAVTTKVEGEWSGVDEVAVSEGTLTLDPGEGIGPPELEKIKLSGGKIALVPDATIDSVEQTGGELTGAGDVTVTGYLVWTAGSQTGTGTTRIAGGAAQGVAFRGDGARTLSRPLSTESGGQWLGHGTLALQGGSLQIAGGQFRVEGSVYATDGQTVPISGSGTVHVGAGATLRLLAHFAMGAPFDNDGTVRWDAEVKLSLEGGGTHSGDFLLSPDPPAPAGVLSLAGTLDHVFSFNSVLLGEGRGEAAVGVTTKVQGEWVDLEQVVVSAGSLTFDPAEGVPAPSFRKLTLLGGKVELRTAPESVEIVNVTQSGGELFGDGRITVTGAYTWSGGTLSGPTGANPRPDTALAPGAVGLHVTGTGAKVLKGRDVRASDLRWDGGNLALDGATVLTSEAVTGGAGARAATIGKGGGGMVVSGSLTVGAPTSLGPHLTLHPGSSVTAERELTLAGGATIDGSIDVRPEGGLRVQGPDPTTRHLITLIAPSGDVHGGRVAVEGGTLEVQGGFDLDETFVLGGLVRVGGGSDPRSSDEVTQVGGTVRVEGGATLLVPIEYGLAGGMLLLSPLGTLDLSDGTLRIFERGVLAGWGTAKGKVTNAGEISPGQSVGTLTIQGDYSQAETGVFRVEVKKGGQEFDRLAVSGAATLDGTLDLDVSGEVKPPPEGLTVLDATSRSGEFSRLLDGVCHGVDYQPDDVLLVPVGCRKVLSNQDVAAIPQLAMSGDDVLAVWTGRPAGGKNDVFLRRGIRGTQFEQARSLTLPRGAYLPKVAASGDTVCLAWIEAAGATSQLTDVVVAVSRDGGVSFRQENVSRSLETPSRNHEIAASGSDCYVAWQEFGDAVTIRLARVAGAGTVESRTLGEGGRPDVASSASIVYVGWNDRGTVRVHVVREAEAAEMHEIAQPAARGRVRLAADGAEAYAVWDGEQGQLAAAASVDGGLTFGAATVLTANPADHIPVIAASAGKAYVAWTSEWASCTSPEGSGPCDGEAVWSEHNGLWLARLEGGALVGRQRLAAADAFDRDWDRAALAARGTDVAVAANVRQGFDLDRGGDQTDLRLFRSGDAGTSFQSEDLSANRGSSGGAFFGSDENHDVALGSLGVFVAWGDSERTVYLKKTQEWRDRWDVFFTSRASGPPDVRVVSLRAIQAIPDASALVAGKPTTLEVVVADAVRNGPTPATLEVTYTTSSGPVTKLVEVVLGGGENVFHLPGDSEGTTFLPGGPTFAASVKVSLPPGVEDAVPGNNSASLTMRVKDTKPLDLLFVPVQVKGETLPTCAQVRTIAAASRDYIHATYPVAPGESEVAAECASPLLVGPDRLTFADVEETFLRLEARSWDGSYDKVVGVVREGFFENMTHDYRTAVALAPYLSSTDAILVERQLTGGWAAAHELSHQMGWVSKGHELSDAERGKTYKGAGAHASDLPAPGYWVTRFRPVTDRIDWVHPTTKGADPADATGRWVSKPTYEYLFDRLKENPADPPVLVLSGFVTGAGTIEAKPWFEIDGFIDAELGETGKYGVRLIGEEGSILGETGFDAGFLRTHSGEEHAGVEANVSAFSVRVPQVPGAATVEITRGQEILFRRTRSPNPPAVSLTSPNGGEALRTGTASQLTWTASDPDGDPLTYVVSLSLNGGQTWTPLATDLTEERLTVTLRRVHETTTALVRVVASDGWNTTEDRSNATFSIVQAPLAKNGGIAYSARRYVFDPALGFMVPNTDVYVSTPGEPGETRITSGDYRIDEEHPDWSADGSKIAFDRCGYTSDYQPIRCDVFVVNADGSGERRVTATPDVDETEPSWSPDGSELVVLKNGDLWAVAVDGSGSRRLTTHQSNDCDYPCEIGSPTWSPDGTQIAFLRNVGYWWEFDVWVVNADGTDERRLSPDPPGSHNPQPDTRFGLTWSPDGTKLAFSVGDSTFCSPSSMCIAIMDVDDRSLSRFTYFDPIWGSIVDGSRTDAREPDWSPDGTKLTFVAGDTRATDSQSVMTAALDGTDFQPLSSTYRNNVSEGFPSWQPVITPPEDDDPIPPPPPPPPPGGKAEPGGPYAAAEGQLVTLDASRSSHPPGSIPLYEWDLDGDGGFDDATGMTPEVIFEEDGAFTIALRATEASGEQTTASTAVDVGNVAPTVDAGPDQEGSEVVDLAPASFQDPGGFDEHTATVDWGDGTSSTGDVAEFGRSGTVWATHTFVEAGTYTVRVRVCDDGGGCGSDAFQTEVVLDTTSPTTTAILAPEPNAAGWAKSPVDVTLTAEDEAGGSGVKHIHHEVAGAQTGTATVAGGTASVTVTAEGVTTVSFHAKDRAGNVEDTKTLVVRVDRTAPDTAIDPPPLVVISMLDGSLTGTATDTLAGVERTTVRLLNRLDGSVTERVAACTSGCDGPGERRWKWVPTGMLPGLYTVTTLSADLAGNVGQPTPPVDILIVLEPVPEDPAPSS